MLPTQDQRELERKTLRWLLREEGDTLLAIGNRSPSDTGFESSGLCSSGVSL
jgi:hypothetical protein